MIIMLQAAQGIPDLPDLTQPTQLLALGQQAMELFFFLVLMTGFLGMAIALIAFALRGDTDNYHRFLALSGSSIQVAIATPLVSLVSDESVKSYNG
ncbi:MULTISPECIES: hypothetical protein [Spirulina sp. CCY15215]|uniref:hypothetical protein n=1 Tax=Spirulina sp. CCY15215 TaxID=2767591 RepID=UPI001951E9FE|nr:hypothetical protein [Spirulina major]